MGVKILLLLNIDNFIFAYQCKNLAHTKYIWSSSNYVQCCKCNTWAVYQPIATSYIISDPHFNCVFLHKLVKRSEVPLKSFPIDFNRAKSSALICHNFLMCQVHLLMEVVEIPNLDLCCRSTDVHWFSAVNKTSSVKVLFYAWSFLV